ncbi:MAG TPA: hypothetical protein VIV06_00370, partial [Candidatus Limnocylindrales bacterium]
VVGRRRAVEERKVRVAVELGVGDRSHGLADAGGMGAIAMIEQTFYENPVGIAQHTPRLARQQAR